MSSRNQQAYERLLEVIKQVVTQKNLQKPLSRYLGKGPQYMTNLFSAGFNLPVAHLFDIADFCQIPASWFVGKAAPRAATSPEDQLLLECEPGGLPANLFLDDLARRLTAVERLPVEKKEGLTCYRPVLEDLEVERRSDRASAQNKTEKLVDLLMGDLLAARLEPLSARRLGELAAALALWGTIQRSYGLRNLAAKALILAIPLARRSGHAWSMGSCLQRAGTLIHSLGRSDLACDLLDQAVWHFVEAGAEIELRRIFVDRGAFLFALPNKVADSVKAYRHALEILPEPDWWNRASALQGLALNFNFLGENETALKYAHEAKAACVGESYVLGCIKWREGAILFDLGQFASAKNEIREALHLLGRYASAGDIALASLDYAEALVRAEDFQEANLLIREVTRWLPELRPNPILHRAISRFLDLARIGELRLAEIAHTRETILGWKNSKPDSTLAIR